MVSEVSSCGMKVPNSEVSDRHRLLRHSNRSLRPIFPGNHHRQRSPRALRQITSTSSLKRLVPGQSPSFGTRYKFQPCLIHYQSIDNLRIPRKPRIKVSGRLVLRQRNPKIGSLRYSQGLVLCQLCLLPRPVPAECPRGRIPRSTPVHGAEYLALRTTPAGI